MSDTTKANRAAKYQSLNLGGVADWAIDLQEVSLARACKIETAATLNQALLGHACDKLLTRCRQFLLRGSDPQDDDIDSIDDEDYLANCDGSFDSLDQLAQANAPLECGPQYVLPILRNMLQVAVVDFNAIMADGYDKYFGIYAQYAADNGGTMLHSFMNEHGNEYFSCNIIEEISWYVTLPNLAVLPFDHLLRSIS